MINLFLKVLTIHFFLIPIGIFFVSKQENKFITYSTQLIYGIVLISFMALFLNFFTPLNQNVNSLTIMTLLLIIYKKWKLFFNKEFILFSLISTFIICFLIIESNVYRPDAGLYHLPYINIINEEKIIFGLSNLHFRYAHASIMQHTSAILNNLLLGINGIILPTALLASAILINFTSRILNLLKYKKYNLELFFLLFIQIYIFYKMNRYSEYGNDAPAHLLFFYLISIILKDKLFDTKEILNLLIISLFVVLNKIILLFSVFVVLIHFTKKHFLNFFKNKRFYFLVLFFLMWIIKNITISGCLIFPITKLCSESFLWSNKNISESVSIENEAWAKGWPDYVNDKNITKEDKLTMKDYSKDFNWIKTWYSKHFKFISSIIFPYILIILLFFMFIFKFKRNKNINYPLYDHRKLYYLFFILLIANVFWIMKVPVFRYGYSYLISIIALIFSYVGLRFFTLKEKLKVKILIIFCIGFLVIFLKNTLRIAANENNYNNYPWPKYYSMSKENSFPELEMFKISNKIFYSPINGDYCMYYKSPCFNYGNYLNAKITNKYGYFFIHLN